MVGNFLEVRKVCLSIDFYSSAVSTRGSYGIDALGRMSLKFKRPLKHFERERNGLTTSLASKRIQDHSG
jgi:hypothetical protein